MPFGSQGSDEFNRASYGRAAQRYASFRPDYPSELFDAVLSHVNGLDIALDCATGTGQAAVHLCEHFERVLAFDGSHRQVGFVPRISNLFPFAASAEAIPVRSHVVDLITVAQAVHWFDLDKFWPETHRLLRPEGVLAIWGYGFFKVDPAVDEIVMRELRSRVDQYWGSGNLILLEEYRTIPFPFDELPAPKLDIVEQWTLERLLAYLSTWSALARYDQEHGPGLLQHFGDEATKVWPEGETKEVRMPITMRLGRLPRT